MLASQNAGWDATATDKTRGRMTFTFLTTQLKYKLDECELNSEVELVRAPRKLVLG